MKTIASIGYFLLVLGILLVFPHDVQANHVLPYPSFMPGNKIYKVTRVLDTLKKYWYFGSIGSYKYHIGLSDKYLVEAKTLFEYQQYLLASNALMRSDQEFISAAPMLREGRREGKDMQPFLTDFLEASTEQKRVLGKLLTELPKEVEWSPEKAAATKISIADNLTESLRIRDQSIQFAQ